MAENSTIIEPAFNYVILMRNEIGHNLLFYMTALMSFISKQCLSGGVHQDSVLKIWVCQEFCVNRFNKQHRIAA